ncbi:MAG: Hsp20/alpha crystallin family protein [Beijerinckiaceae bacterium]|nr:Hsp20/alpha crystallin family protein [Beijerinckiaceae bacterium]
MESLFNRSGRGWPSFEAGFATPAINVAETPDAIEVTAELAGVDEKDISIDLDGSRLVISGEKKAEEKKEEKNWRVVESSYGSFQRSIALPFEPQESDCEAHFDKGVLHLKIAKPKTAQAQNKKIEIKAGAPPSGQGQQSGQQGGGQSGAQRA